MTDRAPPHSLDAERSLLGALMLSTATLDKIAGTVRATDFYRVTHQHIFQAITELAAQNESPDPIAVADWFRKCGRLDQVDNGSYLIGLANDVPTTTGAAGWARIVREKAALRALLDLATSLGDRAISGESSDEIVTEMQQTLIDWTGKSQLTGPKAVTAHAADWLDYLSERSEDAVECVTGLVDVDAGMAGMLPGDLIILAGRPGSGKSAGAMQIALHNARTMPVLVFNLEMSGMQLVKRMVTGGIDSRRVRRPKDLQPDDWRRIQQGIAALKAYQLEIDDTAGLTIDQLCARARAAHRRRRLGMIIVDYLQLVNSRAENRTQEISQISRALKQLAKGLGVPVIALSQLSRKVEERADKRPVMADLRESGQLEQDADQIIFLYRHAYYHEGFESNISEWIRAKHRDAETGTHYVMWLPDRVRFGNADSSAVAQYKSMIEPAKVSKFRMGRS